MLPLLSPPVAAMVELQRLTGMRPGEVVALRPCDVTRRLDGLWVYRPPRFKTEHHEDAERLVFLGPQAQALLRPWLDRAPETPCFSPQEAVAWQRERKRLSRKTPVPPPQRDRSKTSPAKQPGDQYGEDEYRRAIHYACGKAKIPRWSPNQIRHSRATIIRERYGIEAAQVVLGHSRADVTQIYAQRNQQLAAEVARQIG